MSDSVPGSWTLASVNDDAYALRPARQIRKEEWLMKRSLQRFSIVLLVLLSCAAVRADEYDDTV
jgi:hypothetical protein